MKKQSGPSARELPGMEELREFIDNELHSVIGECTLLNHSARYRCRSVCVG